MITFSHVRRVEAPETRKLCCRTISSEEMQRRLKNFNHCLKTAACESKKLTCFSLALLMQHNCMWTAEKLWMAACSHCGTAQSNSLVEGTVQTPLRCSISYSAVLFKFIHVLPTTPLLTCKATLASSDLKVGYRPLCRTKVTATHLALMSQKMRSSHLPAE